MKTITWAPGSDKNLDQLFDELREKQYNDKSHRLWKNYGKDSLEFAVALTICFNDNNIPELCSSIASRDCWPKNAYRILNRLWKVEAHRKPGAPGKMSPSFGYSALSQIRWLKDHTNCQLYFISRETNNWESFAIKHFLRFDINLQKTDGHKYLTCPNECDNSCWQNIIYSGDKEILTQWKHRPWKD